MEQDAARAQGTLVWALTILAVATIAGMVVLIALGQGASSAAIPAFVTTFVAIILAANQQAQRGRTLAAGQEEVKASVAEVAGKSDHAATLAADAAIRAQQAAATVAQKTDGNLKEAIKTAVVATAAEVRQSEQSVPVATVKEMMRELLAEFRQPPAPPAV